MKFIGSLLLRGIDALLPIAITLYAIYWLAFFGDKLLGEIIRPVMPEHWLWPGIGLIAGLVALFLVGVLASTLPGRWLFAACERACLRVPLVKTVFRATQDFTRFFMMPHAREEFGEVVWVPFGDLHVIGFVTRGPVYGTAADNEKDRTVAVYVPFSYQIGGYTVYLPRSRLEPTGLSVEEAMRLVVTAGVSMSDQPVEAQPVANPPPASIKPEQGKP